MFAQSIKGHTDDDLVWTPHPSHAADNKMTERFLSRCTSPKKKNINALIRLAFLLVFALMAISSSRQAVLSASAMLGVEKRNNVDGCTATTSNETHNQKLHQVQNKSDEVESPPSSFSVQVPLFDTNWCPQDAECNNSDLCHPCQQRFLIIIATPRSASTTLTWMMNELPGIRMGGENNDAMGGMRKLLQETFYYKFFQENARVDNAWGHNWIPPQTESCVTQAFLTSLIPPPMDPKTGKLLISKQQAAMDIVGFKTVRFFDSLHGSSTQQDDEFQKMVASLKHNFPCARVLVNINSDIDHQVKSAHNTKLFGNKDKNAIRQQITADTSWLQRLANELGSQRSMLLDKVEWTKDVQVLNQVVKWMGFSTDCYFEELLEFNTNGYRNGNKTKFPPNSKCKPLD